MAEAEAREYLQHALALDPGHAPGDLLAARKAFLSPDELFVAAIADDEGEDDARARWQTRLAEVRRDFWQLADEELAQRLTALSHAGHPETVAAAARLQTVAQERAAMRSLREDRGAHPAFVQAFAMILIVPVSEANRLRERQQSWMRPEENPQYQAAFAAMRRTVERMRVEHPRLFALEEAWLGELLQYNPTEEIEHPHAAGLAGLGMVASIVLTLGAMAGVVAWIFST